MARVVSATSSSSRRNSENGGGSGPDFGIRFDDSFDGLGRGGSTAQMTVPMPNREYHDPHPDDSNTGSYRPVSTTTTTTTSTVVRTQSLPSLTSHESDRPCYDSDSSESSGQSNPSSSVDDDDDSDDDDDDSDSPDHQQIKLGEKRPPQSGIVPSKHSAVGGENVSKRSSVASSSETSFHVQVHYKKAKHSDGSARVTSSSSDDSCLKPCATSSDKVVMESHENYHPTLQAVAPTLQGIHNLVRHLRRHPSLEDRDGQATVHKDEGTNHSSRSTSPQQKSNQCKTSMAALPTECTYEVCSLVSWSKDESLDEEDTAFRIRQLNHLKSAASNEVLHVYMPHQNIQVLDRLLDFPKKKYALKRRPNDIANFNESRVIFQRLADLFWPGACIIYLSPQSHAPSGLLLQNQTVSMKSGKTALKSYIGFRCPSHPLTVRVQKQLQQSTSRGPMVLVGSSVREGIAVSETIEGYSSSSSDSSLSLPSSPLLKANDVIRKFGKAVPPLGSAVQVLQGEERKEIFAVPTCQFEDVVLECWIDASARQITLKGKSKRVIDAQHVLAPSTTKNAVLRSVLQHWKIIDERDMPSDISN